MYMFDSEHAHSNTNLKQNMQRDLKYICSNLRNQGNKRLEDLTLTVGSMECVSSEMKGKPWIMSKDDLNFLFSPLLLVQQEQQKEMFDVFVCVWAVD